MSPIFGIKVLWYRPSNLGRMGREPLGYARNRMKCSVIGQRSNTIVRGCKQKVYDSVAPSLGSLRQRQGTMLDEKTGRLGISQPDNVSCPAANAGPKAHQAQEAAA